MRTIKSCFVIWLVMLLFSVYGCAGFSSGSRAEFSALPAAVPDGVYEGIGRGYRGPIRVQVHIEGGSIAEIDIIASVEESSVGGAAMLELLDLAIAYNTTDLDAISGATGSSRGFLEALENAIFRHE